MPSHPTSLPPPQVPGVHFIANLSASFGRALSPRALLTATALQRPDRSGLYLADGKRMLGIEVDCKSERGGCVCVEAILCVICVKVFQCMWMATTGACEVWVHKCQILFPKVYFCFVCCPRRSLPRPRSESTNSRLNPHPRGPQVCRCQQNHVHAATSHRTICQVRERAFRHTAAQSTTTISLCQ